jgi:hypothetical protein
MNNEDCAVSLNGAIEFPITRFKFVLTVGGHKYGATVMVHPQLLSVCSASAL